MAKARRRAAFAIAASAAVVGGLLVTASISSAEPEKASTGSRGSISESMEEQAEQRSAVRAFQEAFPGVSDAEAWRRIQAEDQRVELITRLATEQPKTFGGSWYDGTTDTQHLQATTANAAEKFADLAKNEGINAKVHQVEHSYAQLAAEAEQARAGTHPVLGDAAKGDATVDVQANRVVVGMADANLNAVRADTLDVPDTIEVGPRTTEVDSAGNPMVEEECPSRYDCDRPLRGGIVVRNATRGDYYCSLGFTAHSKKYPKRKFAIIAGHCGMKDEKIGHNGRAIGEVQRRVYNDDTGKDAAAVRVGNDYWLKADFGFIYNPKHHNEPFKVAGRLKQESSVQAGQVVCLSAYHTTPKYDCGTITGIRGDGYIGVKNMDACPGDSGGGWHRPTSNGRIAYGIHKGGSEGCHGDQGGNSSYFTSIPKVERELGVTIHTR